MAYKVSVTKSKKEKPAKDAVKTAQSKSRLKKVLLILLAVAIVGGAFLLGKQAGKSSSSTYGSSVVNLTYSTTAAEKAPSNPNQSAPTKPPTQEELKAQAEKIKSSRASRTPSSNGRLTLSGTVDKVSDKEISIKTKTGQVFVFSISPEIRVSSLGKGKSTKISDIKQGNQVSVTVSVNNQAYFKVRTIRVSSEAK